MVAMIMPQSKTFLGKGDHPPTERQIRRAESLARIKNLEMLPECYESNIAWWIWINDNLDDDDYDIAADMRDKYNKFYHRDDPTSVIRCLVFYVDKVLTSENLEALRLNRAKKMLKNGAPAMAVAEQFCLSETHLFKIVEEVESQGKLISDY